MYSKNIFESINLIENIFVVGAQNNEHESISSNCSYDSNKIKLQVLLSIPENINIKEDILKSYLSFAFPNGVELSYNLKKPLIYSIVLTNEKGINYYLYILLFYEKITETDLNISLNTLNTQNAEPQYFPVSIIISSFYSNIGFFRNLLIEFYNIIKLDLNKKNYNFNNYLNNNEIAKIQTFQKLEFLNYLHFCLELLRPPNKSILKLNMRFNSLEYKFNSFQELPNNDFCIELLFNVLEISVIIKLFIALLFEKHIIIISNQNLPLFCIGESLKLLLFPLRWPHIYIPNLPYEQIKFLESPIPYLMGINSSLVDVQNLKEQFPSNIICDVNTSSLFGSTSNLNLPIKEENRIKSQLLKLKSKYNNFDEIDYGPINTSFNFSRKTNTYEVNNSNSNGPEEIDYQLSFAENVQKIFFELFKNNLANIKNEYMSGKIFNSQKFLNSFKEPEYKFFFEKLINTLLFEDFILSMQYFDDSLSRQYNSIMNVHRKKSYLLDRKNKYYIYELTIQKNIKEYPIYEKEKLNFIDDYNEISDIFEKNNKKNNYFNDSNKLIKKHCNNSFNQLKDNNSKYDIYRATIRTVKEKEYQRIIYLNFYGKDGFISFYQKYNYFFLYHKKIYKEIHQIYEELYTSYSCNSLYKMIPISNNIEIEDIEGEERKLIDIPINYSAQFYTLLAFYLCYNIEYEKKCNDSVGQLTSNSNIANIPSKRINSANENNSINNEIKNEESNLNINNEISNKINKKKKKKKNNNIQIINLLIRAFKINQQEFPRNIFYTLLNDFSLEELKAIERTNIKYIDKTIQYKIDNIEKNTYKTMVINMDSDIDEVTEESQQLREYHNHKFSDDTDYIKLVEMLDKHFYNKNIKSFKDKEERKNNELNLKKSRINMVDNESFNSFITNSESNKDIIQKSFSSFYSYKINCNSILNNGNCYSTLLLQNNKNKNYDVNDINLFTDPMALCEKICLLLYTFLCNVKIENYNVKNYDINFFRNLAYSNEFDEIKNLIISLKNISIENLRKNPKNYYCFWLNIYNFLTIFSVIYKCEIISNYYEWYRFSKNSYFNIGNLIISLYEIESYILRDREISKRIYTNIIDNTRLKIKQIERIDNNLINFGISLPTNSAPIIRIYYPFNFIDSLKFNAIEFFYRNINYNAHVIEIPEYFLWIDPNFKGNINKYKNLLPKGIFNLLNHKMSIRMVKYDWKMTFTNFKNLQKNK